jgi:hypothetical protein
LKSEPGFSFPKIEINGRTVTLNCGGGTMGGGWVDWIWNEAHALVNMDKATVAAVLDAACAMRTLDDVPADILARWSSDAKRADTVTHMLAERDRMDWLRVGMTVKFKPWCQAQGNPIVEAQVTGIDGRRKKIYAGNFSASFRHIDWAATKAANTIKTDVPDQYSPRVVADETTTFLPLSA